MTVYIFSPVCKDAKKYPIDQGTCGKRRWETCPRRVKARRMDVDAVMKTNEDRDNSVENH